MFAAYNAAAVLLVVVTPSVNETFAVVTPAHDAKAARTASASDRVPAMFPPRVVFSRHVIGNAESAHFSKATPLGVNIRLGI